MTGWDPDAMHPECCRAPSSLLRSSASSISHQSQRSFAYDRYAADRIGLLGGLSDVALLLAGSPVFVVASRYEDLPLSIQESMRGGLPIIASNDGGVIAVVTAVYEGLARPSPPAASVLRTS